MANFHIRILADSGAAVRGIGNVNRALGAVERNATRMTSALRGALAFTGLSVGLSGIIKMSDQFVHLQNRLRVVIKDVSQLTGVTEELLAVANKTRSSFAGTVEMFTRVSIALRDVGTAQRDVVLFTERLNQAIILSGATAQEAEAGLVQLSQGLASGALRGDELRSVLEQLPVVADIIAKEMRVTRGQLRELGKEGAITTDIIVKALLSAEELSGEFAKTVPTLGQAITVLKNNLTALFGTMATGTGAMSTLTGSIIEIANNLDPLNKALNVTVALFLTFKERVSVTADAILKLISGLTGVEASFGAMVEAIFDKITFAFRAVANLISALVAFFGTLRDEMGKLAGFLDEAIPRSFTMFVNSVIDQINKVPFMKDNLIKKFEVPQSEAAEAGFDLGASFMTAVNAALEVYKIDPARNFIDDVEKTIRKIEAISASREFAGLDPEIIAPLRVGDKVGVEPFSDFKPGGFVHNMDELERSFERSLETTKAMNLEMELLGDTIATAFNGGIDALREFVLTGKISFHDLASSIVDDIARIAQRALTIQFLSALGLPVKGFATGGSFVVGGQGGVDSSMVMFRATPGERVDVSTPAQQQAKQAPAPQVNVRVVNVDDPRSTVSALNTAAGERAIMNVIQKNPTTVRRILGGG